MSAAIQRLATAPREMTALEAGQVLERGRDFIGRLIQTNKLEARQDNARGSGANTRYIITREALLIYIVRNTSGDRLALMSTIRLVLPRLLGLAELAAQEGASKTASEAEELPANVIPITRRARVRTPRAQEDLHQGHPDLFPDLLKPQAQAAG